MLNQYVHLGKIGSGSYGKVVRCFGCGNNQFSWTYDQILFVLLLERFDTEACRMENYMQSRYCFLLFSVLVTKMSSYELNK
jgi:hypothetical protein